VTSAGQARKKVVKRVLQGWAADTVQLAKTGMYAVICHFATPDFEKLFDAV
jgi:hypothetical protein